ncbi:MAG TPA: hypothetical protein VK657_13960 [Terriglobales bacterium]|nr:hypothetical protein [Terriglobales bacterium]
MTGRTRLPGGEPRKASQRKTRRGVSPDKKVMPVWRANMPVLWKGRALAVLGEDRAEWRAAPELSPNLGDG